MFAAIIRNAFTHSYKIDPRGYLETKLKSQDIVWDKKHMSFDLVGTKLTVEYFTYGDALKLSLDLHKLVTDKLN